MNRFIKDDVFDCSYGKLTQLSNEIGSLINLTGLYFNNNQLTQLPSEIGNLINLTILYCTYNKLTQLPSKIGNLINLTGLYCNHNNLMRLPNEISNLINLTELYCGYNQLTQLPSEIGKLINLTELYCNSNQLTQLPSEIGNLINLIELVCSNNVLIQLPSEIGNLINLTILFCGDNQLIQLPMEIIQCRMLYVLVYDGNPYLYIAPNILRFIYKTYKNISDNSQNVHLSSIQQSLIGSIKKLMQINIGNYEYPILNKSIKTYLDDQSEIMQLGVNFRDVYAQCMYLAKDNPEVIKLIDKTMIESESICFTGRITNLVNCLSGYYSDIVEITISDNEYIGNLITNLQNKYDGEKLRVEFVKEMNDRGLGDKVNEWIEFLE